MAHIRIVDTLDALKPLATQWNELCLEAPQRNPMLSYAWVASHLEHRLLPNQPWFCVVAEEAGQLVGVLPLIVRQRRFAGRSHSVLCPPTDDHTHCGDALIAAGREREVLPALITAASRHYPRHLRLEFLRLPQASKTGAACTSGIPRHKTIARSTGRGAYLPINGDFDAYRASLSGNFRSNLNKAANKLRQLPAVSEHFIAAGEATAATLPRFIAVEAKSWKGQAGSAILNSSELTAFYQSLTRRLADAGWLEWHLLNVGDDTIAANLGIRLGSTVVVWKLGYDHDYSQCSPGSMLFERLVRHAYRSGDITAIDLLTDHSWYQRWRMQWRDYQSIRLYPPRPAARVAWAADALRQWAESKKRIRQIRTWLRSLPLVAARPAWLQRLRADTESSTSS